MKNTWYDHVIRFGFYALFILVPIILTPWNYELFEYNKMMLTYGLAAIIVGAWLAKMLSRREIVITKTPLDIPLCLFVISQFISTIFSIDPHVSWMGYYSRFNGGMWSVITYTLLFYAFVSNKDIILPKMENDISDNPHHNSGSKKLNAKDSHPNLISKTANLSAIPIYIMKMLKVIIATAAIISLYGVAERLGIDKHLWVQDVQSRVFSSLGQPNWLAAYLVAILPLPLAFSIRAYLKKTTQDSSKDWQAMLNGPFIVWTGITVLFFMVLIFTRSRAGLLGFAATEIIFWGLLLLNRLEFKKLFKPFFVFHTALAIFIFLNGSYVPQVDKYFTFDSLTHLITHVETTAVTVAATATTTGTLLEYGGTESGKIREFVWQAAIIAWKSSTKTFLIGTGTETFAWTFFRFRPVGHNLVSEWDFLYNKAHNEYLNYLATTGIFGLGSYILFIGLIIYFVLKNNFYKFSNKYKFQLPDFNSESSIIIYALFSGWISILITNFFGFSVVVIQLLFFLIPAIILVLTDFADPFHPTCVSVTVKKLPKLFSRGLSAVIFIIVFYILVKLILFWTADTLYASGYRYNRSDLPAQAEPKLERAIELNPSEPIYHDELGSSLAALSISAMDTKNATEVARLAKASLKESDTAISISPQNVNFWKTRTKIFYTLSALDPNLNSVAIEALQKAHELSPNDPKIVYNLAILYGRGGDSGKAINLLLDAKKLKVNYRDVYTALNIFYNEVKNPDSARAILQEYLNKVDPTDQEFMGKLKK
jgi:putative inorganic carbon (hco3(-)) transporter